MAAMERRRSCYMGHETPGIDVSKYQGRIDWDEVAASQEISFAYIRVGDGLRLDEHFAREGLRFEPHAPDRWYLRLDEPARLKTRAPAELAGQPVSGAFVKLAGDGRLVKEGRTDPRGVFEVRGKVTGKLSAVVEKDGSYALGKE